ncbi:MAG: hypothetical protein M3Q47_17930 [Actinomycetota bacterium]|nr:hypothetical protein [Actinomycetota bacterium]
MEAAEAALPLEVGHDGPRTVTCCPASGVAAPLPCTAPTGCVAGVVQTSAGGGLVDGSTAPLLLAAGACQTSSPILGSSRRESDCPAGTPSSRTPMSVRGRADGRFPGRGEDALVGEELQDLPPCTSASPSGLPFWRPGASTATATGASAGPAAAGTGIAVP